MASLIKRFSMWNSVKGLITGSFRKVGEVEDIVGTGDISNQSKERILANAFSFLPKSSHAKSSFQQQGSHDGARAI